MGRFDNYYIELKGRKSDTLEFSFELDNKFFADIEGEEFQRGAVKAHVVVKKSGDVFNFSFELAGSVIVPCDRCLDDLEIDVETSNTLKIKLGEEYADDGDIVVVPETDGGVNIAWYLYEFIALALPMKRVHMPGKCNNEMPGKLKKHSYGAAYDESEDEGDEKEVDPRWAALKGLQIDEDN